MIKIGSVVKRMVPNRPLFAQIMFALLAFIAMVCLSNFTMRDIVHENLVRNARSVFAFAQNQLEFDLMEPKMMLGGFSQTVRSMILRGSSLETIQGYADDIIRYFNTSDSRIMKSVVIFGSFHVFGDAFIYSKINVTLPEDYEPSSQAWYRLALDNTGIIVESSPFNSILSGNKVITYSRCIRDDNGRLLGIIGMEINVKDIGNNIVEIALEQGGYGMLITQDLMVIAHTNPEYFGLHLLDTDLSLSKYSEELLAGVDVLERSLINWKGEDTIAFFRKISNGWYLGLFAPKGPFYQSLTNMALILIMLGSIFSAALIAMLIRIDAARDKSDRESRHKSAFLANMSHEIRTPMNAIIGMTVIGKTSSDSERKDHCFSKIQDASNHLLGVINDILDMSKIEANKFELSPSEFIFEKMLQQVVNVVNFRVDEKNQKLTVHIDQNIPKTIIGDDQRIAQVITNLLGNAIKFTPEKGSISLDTRLVEEKNDYCTIQFSVTDTGIGLAPEQQERVFSSFEQAEKSTTRKYGGTGLGLPISKSIVEMMGGRISLVSELNKGSTFTFIVHLKRGTMPYQGLLSSNVNLSNVRILAVDDDEDILDYFREVSNEFNIQCDTALGGEEAIQLVEKNGSYHIYFVDWKMPGMDGIQLTAELKNHHDPAKSVVIMITAAEWSSVEVQARKAGVDKFLPKPLFPSSIADIISEALGINHKRIEETTTDISGLFKGRRVLLVEDVEINRDIVIALLEPANIEIDCAENGKEALRMFKEAPDKYDMIFMDVQMPEMDGYEATRHIREILPRGKNIPIVAMTANVFREDIARCLEAGMNDHVGKPLDFNEVLKKLQQYIPCQVPR